VSRMLDAALEERQEKRAKKIYHVVEFELVGALAASGVVLLGLSAKFEGEDCLVTLRGDLDGRLQVAFVGGQDFGTCLIKCVTAAQRDKLSWRDSRY